MGIEPTPNPPVTLGLDAPLRRVGAEALRHARELRRIPVKDWPDAERRHQVRLRRCWAPGLERWYPVDMAAPYLPTIHSGTNTLSAVGVIARLIDRSERAPLYRGLTELEADKLATALGLHPVHIWGDLWWDDVNLDADGSEVAA